MVSKYDHTQMYLCDVIRQKHVFHLTHKQMEM